MTTVKEIFLVGAGAGDIGEGIIGGWYATGCSSVAERGVL